MNQFLAACEVVDFKNESVALKAMELADRARTTHELIQLCFEFVRDEIKHSTDFGLSTVTIKASEVLKHCLLYTSPSPRDQRGSRMPSSA